jgi:hypothetical protein
MKLKNGLLVLLMLVSINGYAQKRLFDRFSKMEGVTTVYISKAMLQMMPDMPLQPGVDIRGFAGKLDGLLIMTSENESICRMMRSESSSFAQDRAYEILMKVKDGESNVNFYIRKRSDQLIAELVMLVDGEDEFVFIQMTGNMTMDDIRKLTAGMNRRK